MVTMLAALTTAVLAAAAAYAWPQPLSWMQIDSRELTIGVAAGLGAVVGGLCSLLFIRKSRYGIERRQVTDHVRRLVAGESVLLMRAPSAELDAAAGLLGESADAPPAVFWLPAEWRQWRPVPQSVDPPMDVLDRKRLEEQARQLAQQQQTTVRAVRRPGLLRRLAQGRQRVQAMCDDISAASALQQALPPAVEWLLDNEYILESNARDVRLNLPAAFYRKLPTLAEGRDRDRPRVYSLARELAVHSELRLEEENIRAFIDAYQSVQPLTIAELWALPQMLRIVLINRIEELAARALDDLCDQSRAACWANRLTVVHRREPEQFYNILADLTGSNPVPSPFFVLKLLDYLHDEAAVLVFVQDWLVRTFHKSPGELILQVRNRQTRDRVIIGNAFTSLRQMSLLNWNECFEELSRVEQVLSRDPAGIYSRMDFATRDRYRRVIEEMQQGTSLDEPAIAERVVSLAANNLPAGRSAPAAQLPTAAQATAAVPAEAEELPGGEVPQTAHVGWYLIGAGRLDLARQLGHREYCRFRLLQWAYRHHSAVYFLGVTGALITITALAMAVVVGMPVTTLDWVFGGLVLMSVGQLAVDFVNAAVIRLFPPRILPKMNFRDTGIPDSCRTLVVVPMMLADHATIRAEVEKLEIRYLANLEDNLLFGLYSDFCDAGQACCDGDETLLRVAIDGIRALNAKYGGERFFLFHRNRRWCEGEQKFIGWERKRGKLEELNDLLAGRRPAGAERLVYVGDPQSLADVPFVITLDSDTQLPTDAARRLIETIAHPLNRVRRSAPDRIESGYTIIQPTVRTGVVSAEGSMFTRLFANISGIDPYPTVASDAYQDLTGEGSYHGKGIYDVQAFSGVLSQRFPEARLLSHDLIEGAHVRVGLASDIELYDDFPADFLSYSKRRHRWIRGDWQIADWVLPWVPQPKGGRGPNPLTWFNRWKILDNLRRSLLPAATLALLVGSWLISRPAGMVATALVVTQLLFHCLLEPLALAASRGDWRHVSWATVGRDLLRTVVEITLLPDQAAVALDAIARVIYRRLISHRGLLEWTSAGATQRAIGRQRLPIARVLIPSAAFGALTAVALEWLRPAALELAWPWLAAWCSAPVVGWWISRPISQRQQHRQLDVEDRDFLESIARRTWRYFDDFVNAENHWLPPDNYQVAFGKGLALRTSPTNIGMYLVSVLGAQRFGFLTVDETPRRLQRSLDTIDRLEQFRGHLLNWYDIRSLVPLEPRYVSMVDSGNLLGALWTLDQGLGTLSQLPVLDAGSRCGLVTACRLLHQAILDEPECALVPADIESLLKAFTDAATDVSDLATAMEQIGPGLRELASRVGTQAVGAAEVTYWAQQAQLQVQAHLDVVDRYMAWLPVLRERSAEEIADWLPSAVAQYREALSQAPSLQAVADGNGAVWSLHRDLSANVQRREGTMGEWLQRLKTALDRAQWLAGEMLGEIRTVRQRVRALSDAMDMVFLYNEKRRLFSIGFNVTENRQDRNFYDLLESEARLGSMIAIAQNDVPVDHWFAMSRAYGTVRRRATLLSWNGTMFEYLMPHLFQRPARRTLLYQAAMAAVDVQMTFGRRHRIPWGNSESAFADLDLERTYQYRAFGVPELGLNRGLSERTVVAPYATLLAIDLRPKECLQNLRWLDKLGMLWHYGFYEAMDYHRQPLPETGSATVVRTYMAHHQGMSFLALTNFLHADCLRDLFHADPRIRAVEPLLHERIPLRPPLHHIATRARAGDLAITSEFAPATSQFDTPHTVIPRVQMLSNGRFQMLVTAAGGGYSRWNEFDITRWRSDVTQDPWGTFCYLRDLDSGRMWCNSYQPTGGEIDGYKVTFTLGSAVFRRVDDEIETKSKLIVAPEDDVEIRRITLYNRSRRPRRIELASYLELALAPHATDRQHPAFNKLFIQTEAVPDAEALLAWRRLRDESDVQIFAGHRLTLESGPVPAQSGMQFETDRRRFIGRGASLANPASLRQAAGGTQGVVLDPIFSLRQTLYLAPSQRARISLILAAAASRGQVLELLNRYADPRAISRTAEFAWSSAQVELRLLHIQPEEARRFQQMAAHLVFPNRRLRANPHRLAENRQGQSGLWAHAISGDLPIALVIIGKAVDLALVRQMLQAHRYWRMHGLVADLVIVNEESAGYNEPLREELERLIHFHSATTGLNRPGGIFLIGAAKLPSEDMALLRAAANLVMIGARGTLPQQLTAPTSAPATPLPAQPITALSRDASAPLPFRVLEYFNSLGGFTPDGREYAIYLGEGMNTPAPWTNVLANPHFGTLISETGAGFTWQGNSQRNRLTAWSNDPVVDPPAEVIYLRDEESRAWWSPTAAAGRGSEAYRARHGAGYTVFEHNRNGIEQELTVFVPLDESGGKPLKVQTLKLCNRSGRPRRLSLTYFVEWTLGECRDVTQMHAITTWDDEAKVLLAHNYYHPEYGDRVAFIGLGAPVDSYTADRTAFLGRNGSWRMPAGMAVDRLTGETGAGLDPCGALRTEIRLAPNEVVTVVCLLGQAVSTEEVQQTMRRFRTGGEVESALRETQAWWERRLNVIEVHTPDRATDLLVNRWLVYQTLGCRLWARSGFYQSGGAFGFRDQLQDVLALLHAEPRLARDQILLAASRQFKEGDVQHWWHPPGGAGIRSRISDDLLWLPYALAQYLRVTGDRSILMESVPFLEAPHLTSGQLESFQTPGVSSERSSLFDHCQRAVQHSLRFGEHGLPLIGTGDWNDGMNRVGVEGRGESVWLGWFLATVLQGMAEMAGTMGRTDLQNEYRTQSSDLIEKVEAAGWDGEWYLRAVFDDGSPLGSHENQEAKIDSLSQSWAALAGAANSERTAQALDAAWKHLVRESDRLVLLLTPPFDHTHPSPGYLQAYPPGVRENGGQYTHAAVWLAIAFARRGEGTRAVNLLRLLNPIESTKNSEQVWRYRLEPYVLAGDVYSQKDHVGRGGWSWYTGSAGWLYRAWVEEVLGLQVRGERMRLVPVIPAAWDGFRMTYRRGETRYEIQVDNPAHVERGVTSVEIDGNPCEDGWIPLTADGMVHRVQVRMGCAAKTVRPSVRVAHASNPRPASETNVPPRA